MEKTSQEKYRESLIEKYQERAWECLALYNYYGRQYAEIEKQVNEMQDRIKKCETEIREIEARDDHHTVENKNRAKALKKDCEDYEKRIEGVGTAAKKLFDKSVGYREEGVRLLEQIEDFKAFNMKTPEEIEKAKVEEKPAEEAKSNA